MISITKSNNSTREFAFSRLLRNLLINTQEEKRKRS